MDGFESQGSRSFGSFKMVQVFLKSAVFDGEAYAKMVFLTIGKGRRSWT